MGGVESNTPCIKSSGCGNFIHKLLKNHSANKLDEARQHRQRKRETERQGDEETERREDRETGKQRDSATASRVQGQTSCCLLGRRCSRVNEIHHQDNNNRNTSRAREREGKKEEQGQAEGQRLTDCVDCFDKTANKAVNN